MRARWYQRWAVVVHRNEGRWRCILARMGLALIEWSWSYREW